METFRIIAPLQPGPVELAEYSHAWPIHFTSEKRSIVRVLRDAVERACAEDRAPCERRKRELAGRPWESLDDYARANSGIIGSILAQAAS